MPRSAAMSNHASMNARPRPRPKSSLDRGYVHSGDLEMYYEQQGSGRPLLLLHAGFSSIAASFNKLRPAFVDRWTTIAFEQQAHGHTADIDRPLSYEQMVEDTASAMRQLDIAEADVFGWSDGGVVALGLATRHPQLVRRVAIIGAGYSPSAEPPEFKERMRRLEANNENLAPFREAYHKVAPHPEQWPTLIEKVRDGYFAFEGWSKDELRKLAAPLLVMVGDRDIVTLEHAIELFRLVPDGKLAVLPGSDHGAPVARVEWIKAMLLDFLQPPTREE